jgi:hypothetical protein
MSILSHAEYLNRWTATAPNGFGQTICPPCYHEYLQREIYFNDYLDLFRNEKTFEREDFEGYEDKFYVKITNCPILGILGIPEHELYTINIDGIEYLLVDYDYPWTNIELNNKRYIKYILIGEAAPQQSPKLVGYGLNDNQNSYFYNHYHINTTQFFSAPCSVFDIIDGDKKRKLINLADNGFVLLDLFPFATNYNGIRSYLNLNNVTLNYFNNYFDNYSIHSRVIEITNLFSPNFQNQINSALLAPPKTSHFLASYINNNHVDFLNFRNGLNTFEIENLNDVIFKLYIDLESLPNSLVGLNNNAYELVTLQGGNIDRVPYYSCCCYNETRGENPRALFIKNALGLP